ncbi:MAG: hypothetical protein RL095_2127 [Verrucomicrobiota bacterium]|jgi:hypothetical protein
MLATQAQLPIDLKPALHAWVMEHRYAKLGIESRAASNANHSQLISQSAQILREGGKLRLATGAYELVARAHAAAFVVDILDMHGECSTLTYLSPEDAVQFMVGSYDGSDPGHP